MSATLACPNCGAPASGADATRCGYCGSALATVACPSCFEPMFAGMQFCPHCGAKGSRDLSDEDSPPLSCPACSTMMRVVRVGETVLRECPSCASNWVDADTFTAMCANREQRGAVASIIGTSANEAAPALGGAVRYLPCPRCKKLMNRTNFGQRSGVIIDVCKGHGAWFEPRELRNVLAFIDSGRFERARADEAKRRADEQRALSHGAGASGASGAGGASWPMGDGASTDGSESFLDRALRNLLF